MNLIIFMFCAIVLLVGLILTVTPWLMPKTECFTVTVPHGARNEEPLRGLLRSYTCWMVAITALCVLAWPATLALGRIDVTTRSGEFVLTLLLFVTTFAPIIASFALMLSYRARVKAVKQERGWTAEHAAAAFVGTEDFPKPLSLAWNLLYLPLIGGLAAFTLSHYDQFPSQIPMNIDLAGNNRLNYTADVKIIRVPCSCRVNPSFVLRAFQRGADGVLICGCHPGDCHYTTGNYYTRRRMTLLFSMLSYLGIEKERTRVEWISAAEGAKFAATMNEFVKTVSALGKNRRLEDLRCKK